MGEGRGKTVQGSIEVIAEGKGGEGGREAGEVVDCYERGWVEILKCITCGWLSNSRTRNKINKNHLYVILFSIKLYDNYIYIYILPEGKRFRYDFRQRMKQWLAYEGQGQEVHTFEEHRGLSKKEG